MVSRFPLTVTQMKLEVKKDITQLVSLFKNLCITNTTNGVNDIDLKANGCLFLASEYASNIYEYLYSLEKQQPIVKDHLAGQKVVLPHMRAMLIDWLSDVHRVFSMTPETIQLTVAIIDRYLQVVKDTDLVFFQLIGTTALIIAAKYEERYPPPFEDLVVLGDYTFTTRQIRQMEMRMLKVIDFNLSHPLPIQFLRRYEQAANAEEQHHVMSQYFVELAAIDYDLASCRPSEIAAASLFLALHLLNGNSWLGTGFNDGHWSSTLGFYSHYTAAQLRPTARKIARLVRNAPRAMLKATYFKYQGTEFHMISLRMELYGPLIDSIIGQSPRM